MSQDGVEGRLGLNHAGGFDGGIVSLHVDDEAVGQGAMERVLQRQPHLLRATYTVHALKDPGQIGDRAGVVGLPGLLE
jgi:hypothetical protein